jgi:GMP synthase (glutamine-hydrolysing)
MKRKMAILVTGEPVPRARAERGSFAQMIERRSGGRWPGELTALDARSGGPWPDPAGFAGLIVTGSPASVTERADWILRSEAYLCRATELGTPIFGICFGHQLLGQALGGQVTPNPRGRQIGTVELELEGVDPLADERARPFSVNTTHRDIVAELPPGARVLGRTPRDAHAFVRYAEHVWGVQFHPEFDGATVRGYIEERREILREEGFDVEGLLARVNDALPAAEMLARFVALCAKLEAERA